MNSLNMQFCEEYFFFVSNEIQPFCLFLYHVYMIDLIYTLTWCIFTIYIYILCIFITDDKYNFEIRVVTLFYVKTFMMISGPNHLFLEMNLSDPLKASTVVFYDASYPRNCENENCKSCQWMWVETFQIFRVIKRVQWAKITDVSWITDHCFINYYCVIITLHVNLYWSFRLCPETMRMRAAKLSNGCELKLFKYSEQFSECSEHKLQTFVYLRIIVIPACQSVSESKLRIYRLPSPSNVVYLRNVHRMHTVF